MPPKPSVEKSAKTTLPKVTPAAARAGGSKVSSNSTNTASGKLKAVTASAGGGATKLPDISPTKAFEKKAVNATTAAAAGSTTGDEDRAKTIAGEAEAAAKKLADEVEAAMKLAEEAAKKAVEEAERRAKGNGDIKLIYEQYDEPFPIVDGVITAEAIDDVYCLSFVMPGCLLKLSLSSPTEKRMKEDKGIDVFISEQSPGVFQGLEKDKIYYVYVFQDAEQLKKDQEKMKLIASQMEGYGESGAKLGDFGEGESCSCLFGNPCVNEYGCKDWDNRFAVATKNGWKGF